MVTAIFVVSQAFRQQVARVFCRHAELDELVVGLERRLDRLVERLCRTRFVDRGRTDELGGLLERDVALRLLVERREAVAHQLVRHRTRDAVDGKGVARMLKRREMPAFAMMVPSTVLDSVLGKRLHRGFGGGADRRVAQSVLRWRRARLRGLGVWYQTLYVH